LERDTASNRKAVEDFLVSPFVETIKLKEDVSGMEI
jgi:hypothetical protein